MTRMTRTNQKKNTTMPGISCPDTVLVLATAPQLPSDARINQRTGTMRSTDRPAASGSGRTEAYTRDRAQPLG